MSQYRFGPRVGSNLSAAPQVGVLAESASAHAPRPRPVTLATPTDPDDLASYGYALVNPANYQEVEELQPPASHADAGAPVAGAPQPAPWEETAIDGWYGPDDGPGWSEPCDCGSGCEGECRERGPGWTIGFDIVFVKPRFEDNIALTVTEGDNANFEAIRDVQFDYDLQLSPRIWAARHVCDGIGYRAVYWHFEHDANTSSASPPDNGFGLISHPSFGSVDLSSSIPGDTYTANTSLNVYAIDFEATKEARLGCWYLLASGGLRYAHLEQHYSSELRNSDQTLRGRIDFGHQLKGIGPTMAVRASRPIHCDWQCFGTARGALLLGDGESQLAAGEDLDLTTPFNTTRESGRDDLLPIGELAVGVQWNRTRPGSGWRFFLSTALEAQVWGGAGNAASEDGALGLFGLQARVGWVR